MYLNIALGYPFLFMLDVIEWAFYAKSWKYLTTRTKKDIEEIIKEHQTPNTKHQTLNNEHS